MQTSPADDKPVVVLIGNYPLDRQESMLRFRDLVQSRLVAEGFTVEMTAPPGFFGRISRKGGLGKWFGNFDKYLVYPMVLPGHLRALKKKYAGRKVVVHICDHSNAVYAGTAKKHFPVLVTCHDLLAVRGALGEDTGAPASAFGKHLQRAILKGLGEATEVVCVSHATKSDLVRLGQPGQAVRAEVIPLGLNYPYRAVPQAEAMAKLRANGLDLEWRGYVLNVGSSTKRKNRESMIEVVAQIKDRWPGLIVYAGDPLLPHERALAETLGVLDRVREIRPDNETLQALYSAAHAFVFLSRAEGFGWPILEAQMAECPVICSNRTSVPEVAGDGALVHEPDAYADAAGDVLRLIEPSFRDHMIAAGLKNARAYTVERMMASYEAAYRRI